MGAPKLTDEMINKAVMLLDGWSGKLTWDLYLATLKVNIGHKYTKASMLRQPRIKAAWDYAKKQTSETSEGGFGNVVLSQAKDRIKRLEARCDRLERENNQLLEQFLRWSYNATIKGLTPDFLDRPLPPGKKKRVDN